jgi:tetratricopeptide (TPR) repeat protein
MTVSFGELLRTYRKKAEFTQIRLQMETDIDASLISRYETGKSRPDEGALKAIMGALGKRGIPREEQNELWKAAGFSITDNGRLSVADPVVNLVEGVLRQLNVEERQFVSDDLRSALDIDQGFLRAERTVARKRWEKAISEFSGLRGKYGEREQGWYLRLDSRLAWCMYGAGKYGDAVRYYESALGAARQLADLCERRGMHHKQAELQRKEAEILIRRGDIDRRRGRDWWNVALDCYEQAEKIFSEKLVDRIGVADCLRKTAGVYLYQGRPDRALPLIDRSIRMSQGEGDGEQYVEGTYRGWQHQAWAYDILGRWDEATQLCEDAVDLVESHTTDEWELAKAHRYLGDAYRLQRRPADAERAYKQALHLLQIPEVAAGEEEELKVTLLLGMIELGLGQVCLKKLGGQADARYHLNRSMYAHQRFGEDFTINRVFSEQGQLLLSLGRLEAAEARLLAASRELKKWNTVYYAITLATLCDLYYQKRDFDKLFDTAEDAREADNGLINYQLCRVEFLVGRARIDQEAYSEALDVFQAVAEKALDFNAQTFREVCEDISGEVGQAIQADKLGLALQVCESQIEFWEDRLPQLEPAQQELVHKWLEEMRRKREEVEAFKSIEV